MASYIKGIVEERRNGSIFKIKLKTGRRFWTRSNSKLRLRQHVYVAWDYTHERPTQVHTKNEFDNLPDEFGLEEPELGAFSIPDDEGSGVSDELEADMYIPDDDGFVDLLDFDDLESEPGAFSDPKSDGE